MHHQSNLLRSVFRFSGACILALLLLPLSASAQNKKELEEKRKKLTREIEVTSKLLKKTAQTKAAAYDRFVTLQNQIDRRESLISTIENEVKAIDENVARNTVVVESLNRDVQAMKEEYGKMIRHSFRRKTLTSPLLYILSAESLNQAFRRLLFLRKYDRFRKGQSEAIAFTATMLTKKISNLEQTKREKEDLLISMQGQSTTLTSELSQKNELLESLNQDETRLKQELQKKQADKVNLDATLEKIIAVEIAKKADEAAARRKKAAEDAAKAKASKAETAAAKSAATPAEQPVNKSTSTAPTAAVNSANSASAPALSESESADDDAFSVTFKKQRGKLAAPVEGGVITRGFGRQKHPTLKNIEITNNGIDIRTDEDAPVRAVFDGKIAGVQYIPGHEYTIIVQHGNYYSVYANLSQTSLKKGDDVQKGQTLGSVSTNPISGAAELHFELWHNKDRINPAQWIK